MGKPLANLKRAPGTRRQKISTIKGKRGTSLQTLPILKDNKGVLQTALCQEIWELRGNRLIP